MLIRNSVLLRIVMLSVIILLAAAPLASGQDGAGQHAAEFLTIGTGASSAGMGGAYTAVASGALASYWNPAGLSVMESGELALGHFSLYQDITLSYGSFAFPVAEGAVAAVSVTYLGYGQIERYDALGNSDGDLSVYDWAAGLSLGYQFTPEFSIGLTGKFINQRLDNISGSAAALDIGARYSFGRWIAGGTVTNIGSGLKYDNTTVDLPTTARIGLAVDPGLGAVTTSVELEREPTGGVIWHHGFEASFQDQYFVRTGYQLFPSDEERTFASGLSFGAGYVTGGLSFDYAFTNDKSSASEVLHRFSLGIKIGN